MHYPLLVIYEGSISDAAKKVDDILKPYGCDAGPEQISVPRSELERKYDGVIKNTEGKWSNGYAERAREMGFEEWVRLAYKSSEFNKNLDVITKENPDYKWDWYEIGGRFSGEFKLKKTESAKKIYPPNVDSVDAAYAKDLALESMKLVTAAVLDEKGFHEPKDLDDENELKIWETDFKKRFLAQFTDKTVFVIIDLHA
jgi:hypothetical protein